MADPDVRVRTWVRGSADDTRSGLLGYLSVSYGALLLDGITVRRSASGRLALSFPAKTDRAGRRHSYVQPVDNEARRAIEREILTQLAQREELVP